MDGLVGGKEGQTVGELEALLRERAALARAGSAQRGLVNQLKCEARFDTLAGWPVHPQSRSQVPRRRCSGTNNQRPTRLPLILSANSWRTPRSTLVGSQGSALVRFLVR